MPCVCRGNSRHLPAHCTHHDGFVFYMHPLGFQICLNRVRPEHGTQHVMCTAMHAWQASAINQWMDDGCFSLRNAHVAGWLVPSW